MDKPHHQLNELIRQGQIAVRERHAEDLCGFGNQTFRRYRREGTGPNYCRKGSRIVYLISDLIGWLEANRYSSRAQEVARG